MARLCSRRVGHPQRYADSNTRCRPGTPEAVDFWSTRNETLDLLVLEERQAEEEAKVAEEEQAGARQRSWGPASGAPARCASAEPRVETRFRWKSSYPSGLDRARVFDPSRVSPPFAGNTSTDRLLHDPPRQHIPRATVEKKLLPRSFGGSPATPPGVRHWEMHRRTLSSQDSSEALPSSPYATPADISRAATLDSRPALVQHGAGQHDPGKHGPGQHGAAAGGGSDVEDVGEDARPRTSVGGLDIDTAFQMLQV